MSFPFPVLEHIPIFSLTNPVLEKTDLLKIFNKWPKEKIETLQKAQKARDILCDHMTQKVSLQLRLEDINRYLPFALAIENEVNQNPDVCTKVDLKISWRQSPIVVPDYQPRKFGGKFFSVEILHLLWLRSTLLLDEGYLLSESCEYEKSIPVLRELAGIFNYLSGDRLRVTTNQEALPIEFQSAIFQSMNMLALSEVYALLASKAERDNFKPLSLCKLCYTVNFTLQNALQVLSTINESSKKIIHPQYREWLSASSNFFSSTGAILCSFYYKTNEKMGSAISLLRYAISKFNTTLKLPKCHERISNPIKEILPKIIQLEKTWADENMVIQQEYIPEFDAAENLMAQICTTIPNLPQPIPYILPEMYIQGVTPDPFDISGNLIPTANSDTIVVQRQNPNNNNNNEFGAFNSVPTPNSDDFTTTTVVRKVVKPN